MVLRASSDAVVMRSKAPVAYVPTSSSFAAWRNWSTWGININCTPVDTSDILQLFTVASESHARNDGAF